MQFSSGSHHEMWSQSIYNLAAKLFLSRSVQPWTPWRLWGTRWTSSELTGSWISWRMKRERLITRPSPPSTGITTERFPPELSSSPWDEQAGLSFQSGFSMLCISLIPRSEPYWVWGSRRSQQAGGRKRGDHIRGVLRGDAEEDQGCWPWDLLQASLQGVLQRPQWLCPRRRTKVCPQQSHGKFCLLFKSI